jgi:DNA-binding response OmpR family regulator
MILFSPLALPRATFATSRGARRMKWAKRIVLVQEDPYLFETRKALLEHQGYTVEAVHRMADARRLCKQFACDLVIVDSEENYRAALELCDEIKANDPSINVAVIAWNQTDLGSDCPDEVIRRERGPQEFLNKVRLALA